jgi:DNA-binding transcriptional ArsR family regulator
MNEVFQALNDPIRRQILRHLRKKDLTAGEIGEKFDVTGASISFHLDKLKRAGLVTSVKKGQFVHYSLNTTVLDDILEYLVTLKKK